MTRPRDVLELSQRAAALAGRTLGEVAAEFAAQQGTGSLLHRKGKLGQLVERVLGASAGSRAEPDFPELGVELKTIPLDDAGRPRESTFVASFSLADADTATWESSSVRHKLAHVLWIPVITSGSEQRFGRPLFWRPTREQEQVLRADFDDIMGTVAIGNVEGLTAHVGRWLQARPKAAHGRVRTLAYDEDGPQLALPRGFYLRARVTCELLRDPCTLAFSE
ncbi:MAG: DNA mismatch repair protein MutH [Myxococcales bacterium]